MDRNTKDLSDNTESYSAAIARLSDNTGARAITTIDRDAIRRMGGAASSRAGHGSQLVRPVQPPPMSPMAVGDGAIPYRDGALSKRRALHLKILSGCRLTMSAFDPLWAYLESVPTAPPAHGRSTSTTVL